MFLWLNTCHLADSELDIQPARVPARASRRPERLRRFGEVSPTKTSTTWKVSVGHVSGDGRSAGPRTSRRGHAIRSGTTSPTSSSPRQPTAWSGSARSYRVMRERPDRQRRLRGPAGEPRRLADRYRRSSRRRTTARLSPQMPAQRDLLVALRQCPCRHPQHSFE